MCNKINAYHFSAGQIYFTGRQAIVLKQLQSNMAIKFHGRVNKLQRFLPVALPLIVFPLFFLKILYDQ
ncbi:hypothetical protein BH10BAC3_BH10BAC3_32400 [soil metagenome]